LNVRGISVAFTGLFTWGGAASLALSARPARRATPSRVALACRVT
jgi:hypothetical protein